MQAALTPTPDPNYGTIAEINGRLVHVESEHNPLLAELESNIIRLYPAINFTPLKSNAPDYDNSQLLDDDSNFYEATINDIKTALLNQWEQKRTMLETLPIYKPAKQLFDYIYENYIQENSAMKEHMQLEAEQTKTMKCIAWHPHLDMIAVGHGDNQVYIYEKLNDNMWSCQVLAHKKMHHIRCMEWKKNAGGTLAVGCKEGVCVWTIPKTAAADQQQQEVRYHPSATMRYLTYPNQTYISSIAWDPTPGSHLLAVVSATSSTLVVHDLLLNRTAPLKRYGRGGNHILRWSPGGEWLFVGGSCGMSRLWNTAHWESRPINNPAGLWVQAACWSTDNRTLYYSMSGMSEIHMLHLTGTTPTKSTIIESKVASVHAETVESVSGNPVQVGGVIRDMSIDPRNGQRLTVAFDNSELIAMYSVKPITSLSMNVKDMLLLLGYTRGSNVDCSTGLLSIKPLHGAKPSFISYASTFQEGALLAIAWDNGLISFVTQKFVTEEEIKKRLI